MDRHRAMLPVPSMIWSVQYLRAIAAIGVVAFHALTETGHDFDFGATGVDLFFGISGFLMYYMTHGKSIRPLDFIWRRFLRIAPLYWIATLLTAAATFVRPGYFWQASRDVSRIVLSLLFIPQNGVEGGIYPVLYQGWTLQYEAFFYLLFALSLLLPGTLRLVAMTVVIGGLTTVGKVAPATQNPLFLTYTDGIALEFVAGAWVGWACARPWPDGRGWRFGYLTALVGGWGLLFAAWWYDDPWGALAFPATVTAICLILAGSVMLERYRWMPRLPVLRTLGEASYAIYLFQTFGFVGVAGWDTGHPIVVRLILFTVAAVVVGMLAYWWIEKPVDRLVRRARTPVPDPVPLEAAGALV